MKHRLRVGYANLRDGGVDHGDDYRLQTIVGMLADERLHVVCLVEAKWGLNASWRLHETAHRLGMTGRFLVRAPRFHCDLAVLVDETVLQVEDELHEGPGPWFHALARVQCSLPGYGRVDVIGAHFAPSAKEIRVLEAGMFRLYRKWDCIVGGDFNAVAVEDLANPDDFRGDKEHKLDQAPAKIMAEAGFRDVGARFGDLSCTVFGDDVSAHRGDRLYTNLPGLEVIEYKVIPPVDPDPYGGRRPQLLTDHGLVVAEIAFGEAAPDRVASNGVHGLM